MSNATGEVAGNSSNEWNGYNNVGVCAVAIMATLYHSHRLSLPKALLVMPFAMHEESIRFLANGKIKPRHITALASSRADLFANFRQRYVSSLAVTLNTIQMLVETKHVQFERDIRLARTLEIDKKFGERAAKIVKASSKLATLLDASEEELYLNLRVWL